MSIFNEALEKNILGCFEDVLKMSNFKDVLKKLLQELKGTLSVQRCKLILQVSTFKSWCWDFKHWDLWESEKTNQQRVGFLLGKSVLQYFPYKILGSTNHQGVGIKNNFKDMEKFANLAPNENYGFKKVLGVLARLAREDPAI